MSVPRSGAPRSGTTVDGKPSVIDPATLRAYLETHYRVEDDPPFTLQADTRSDALFALHARHHAVSSAFVTACNPCGRLLPARSNAARQARLVDELERTGRAFVGGTGRHPSGDWPGEASALVLGLDLEAACTLARRHEQNAFLWSGGDATPRLVLLR